VGGGGREHALVWKISQSPLVEKIYCAPGNGGIAAIAECLPVKATDIEGMITAAKDKQIDLVMVAPDDPLAAGMVDAMEAAGIRAFGPRKNAAILESSKAFSKELMKKYNIPTAAYEVFEDCEHAIEYLKHQNFPIVIKADGLALGKGVIIANGFDQAQEAVNNMMTDKVFGNAGSKVVIEEFLTGMEVTILAFTDGKTVVPMASSQDHKRAYDDDTGLNTGGMGTFSPIAKYDEKTAEICMNEIFKPTIDAMLKEGRQFKGVLYFGLMLTENGPKVIEYNARFGDPEAQVVLPRMKNDIIEVFDAVIDEKLENIRFEWDERASVCVVMASGGYPGSYTTGYEIEGIKAAEDLGLLVFHAGTKLGDDGKIITSGGRVLGVTSLENDLKTAIKKAYDGVSKISFPDVHYRTDIGKKGL
ncbi:MAG: phosphoribosylamine--glycine ligase, partial [Clostridiales bacterium]|nr:phosphoribosylamine--glycine ligase [Clostridiales bacterium]